MSPAVAYYRSLQGGPPDPAPPPIPRSPRSRSATPRGTRGGGVRGVPRRVPAELFARSAGVAASALKAAREAGVQKIVMHAAKADGAWGPGGRAGRPGPGEVTRRVGIGTPMRFLADDAAGGAKLQAFAQLAKPVKVIIGRRAFDDVLERRPHMAERRDVLNGLGAAGVSAVYTSGGTATPDRPQDPQGVVTHRGPVPGSPAIVVSGGVVLDRVQRLAAYTGATQFCLDPADVPEPEPDRRGRHRSPGGGAAADARARRAAAAAGAGRVGRRRLALAPPRPPATPAAAAALVPRAAGALRAPRWHAGTNDPDADHEKGDVAPRRFGGPAPPPPPKAAQRSPRSGRQRVAAAGPNPPDVPQGLREELRPPARAHGPREDLSRAARVVDARGPRAPLRADEASRSNSPRPRPPDGRRRGRPGARAARAAAPGRLAGPGGPGNGARPPGSAQGLSTFWGRGRRLARLGRPRGGAGRRRHGLRLWGDHAPEIKGAVGGVLGGLGAGRSPGRAPSGSWGDLSDGPAPFAPPPSPARPVPFVPPSVNVPPPPEVATWPRDLSPRSRSRRERRGHRAGHRRAGRLRRPAGHRAAAPVG